MGNIGKPMDVPDLNIEPPITGKVRLSEDMQQTLAMMTAYCDNKRVTLKASQSGVLNTASAKIRDIKHYKRTDGANPTEGDSALCTECLIMAHPDNTGTIWVRPDKAALTTNAWPLGRSDAVSFTLDNLKQLKMNIVTVDDSLIVAYSR